MKKDYFPHGFVGFFAVVLIVLFVFFVAFSSGRELTEGAHVVLWAAFLLIFVLFGVIVISLYVRRFGRRRR